MQKSLGLVEKYDRLAIYQGVEQYADEAAHAVPLQMQLRHVGEASEELDRLSLMPEVASVSTVEWDDGPGSTIDDQILFEGLLEVAADFLFDRFVNVESVVLGAMERWTGS